VTWIVVFLVILPHGIRPDPKPFANGCLVIVDTVLDPVGFARVVEDETLVILGTGIHHLTKHVECREDAKKSLVQALAVLNHIFTEHKDVIDIGTQVGCQVHTVLHRQQKEDFPVTPVHETLSDTRVLHERLVVHTVVEKQKGARFPTCGYDSSLPLENLFNRVSFVVAVNEQVGNKLLVVVIAILCAGHDDTNGQVSLMVHNVRDERGFPGTALADEHAHFVIADFTRVKLFELEIHVWYCTGFFAHVKDALNVFLVYY